MDNIVESVGSPERLAERLGRPLGPDSILHLRTTDWTSSLASPPERLPSEPMPHKRQHRENEEDDEEYPGSFPGEGCHASEAKEGSDQSDDEKHDGKS
jgi:hypothetical protein